MLTPETPSRRFARNWVSIKYAMLVTIELRRQVGIGAFVFWNVRSGTCEAEIKAHSDLIRSLSLSEDGNKIASGSEDNTVRVWHLNETPENSDRATDEGIVDMNRLAFSPDGKLAATSSSDGFVRIWDVRRGRLHRRFDERVDHLTCVAFSPDGLKLATAASPFNVSGLNSKTASRHGSLKLWDLETGQQLQSADVNARDIHFTPNGKHLIYSHAKSLVLWDVPTWTAVRAIKADRFLGVQLDIAADRICAAAGVWEYPSLKQIYKRPSTNRGFGSALSPDGRLLAVSNHVAKTVELRELPTGKLIESLSGMSDFVLHLDFSPDGERLASATQQGTVVVWNIETGNEVIRYRDHKFWCFCARWSPDGNTLASTCMGRFVGPSIVFHRAVSNSSADALLRRVASE